jgi:uncharacterized membrane protein YhaH (DUF805 family)
MCFIGAMPLHDSSDDGWHPFLGLIAFVVALVVSRPVAIPTKSP